MVKNISAVLLLILMNTAVYAESEKERSNDCTDIIPLMKYETLKMKKQQLSTYTGGLVIIQDKSELSSNKNKDSFTAALLYGKTKMEEEPLYEYPDNYTNIEFLLQKKKEGHNYFSIFRSNSDKPVSGGLNTYKFLTGYGYEIINTEKHSLYLGGSLAVYDWGIEMSNGESWPLLPLPFIHYEYTSPLLFCAFDFTSSPMLDLTIAPENKLRLNSSILVADAGEWEDCGIKCDINLEYRFFSPDHEYGDFAGIRAGVSAEDYTADLSDSDISPIQTGWKSVYAALDLSFLEVIYGYGYGKTYYKEQNEQNIGSGYYLSIQAAWMF